MVDVLFRTESHYPASRKKIIASVQNSLSGKIKRPVEVSISIVGDRQMRQLNKTYRNLDSTTDVLSFPLNDASRPDLVQFVDAPDGVLRLGDIVISYPQAVAEAAADSVLVDEKIIFLVLHGLDHLLGIHHPE